MQDECHVNSSTDGGEAYYLRGLDSLQRTSHLYFSVPGASACTTVGLMHVSPGNEQVYFSMLKEVVVSKEDALISHQEKTQEWNATMITLSSSSEVRNVFHN